MFEMDLKLDEKALRYAERRLASVPGGLAKAAVRSINRTLNKARAEWSRAMSGEYMISAKKAKASLKVHDAKAGKVDKLYGEVVARGPRLELIEFSSNKKAWSSYAKNRKPRIGATVQVKRSGFKGAIPGTFVERGRKSGRLHLMWRKMEGSKRAPREARILYGPSTQAMADQTAPKVSPALQRYFRRRFIHEARHISSLGRIDTYQGRKG